MSNQSDELGAGSLTAGLGGDKLMIELLSGQAVIEAKEYKVLDWEQMQKLKKVSITINQLLCALEMLAVSH